MAEQKNVFEELAPYARMVVVPGVTVGQLTYINQQTLFSDSVFSTSPEGLVAANQNVTFFSSALNDSADGQGFAAGQVMTLGQTNSKFSRGQAPANQCYVAVAMGFQISRVTSANTTDVTNFKGLLTPKDVFSIAQNFAWSLSIGRGIERTIGQLCEWPAGTGAWGLNNDGGLGLTGLLADIMPSTIAPVVSAGYTGQLGSPNGQMRRLHVPIVFPPLVNVSLRAQCGNAFLLQTRIASAETICIRQVLKGYLMTMPAG